MTTKTTPESKATQQLIGIMTESLAEPDLYALELTNGNTTIGTLGDFIQDDEDPDTILLVGIKTQEDKPLKYIRADQIIAIQYIGGLDDQEA